MLTDHDLLRVKHLEATFCPGYKLWLEIAETLPIIARSFLKFRNKFKQISNEAEAGG